MGAVERTGLSAGWFYILGEMTAAMVSNYSGCFDAIYVVPGGMLFTTVAGFIVGDRKDEIEDR